MQARQTKPFTTARKSISKSAKLPSLVAKCCKIEKIYNPAKLTDFVCDCTRTEQPTIFAPISPQICYAFQWVIHFIYKFALRGYIFLILQVHFATKLCNFANFMMLLRAVVKYFVRVLPGSKFSLYILMQIAHAWINKIEQLLAHL